MAGAWLTLTANVGTGPNLMRTYQAVSNPIEFERTIPSLSSRPVNLRHYKELNGMADGAQQATAISGCSACLIVSRKCVMNWPQMRYLVRADLRCGGRRRGVLVKEKKYEEQTDGNGWVGWGGCVGGGGGDDPCLCG